VTVSDSGRATFGPEVGGRPTGAEARRASGLLVYLLVLVALQTFLLVVAVEGLLGGDAGLARAAAALSVVLFVAALALRWFVGER
jgi:hypothetical protein